MSILSKSVCHFVFLVKHISLNSTITQARSSYGTCLCSSLCSKNISFKIPIDPLTSSYFLSSLIYNIILYPTFNAVSFENIYYFKQRFAPFGVIKVQYWGIMITTEARNMFRYLIVGSILYLHCVTRWIASLQNISFLFIDFWKKTNN